MLITALQLLPLFLASPAACPADVGQIRWDGFVHELEGAGASWKLTGSVWDRDTDGKPSAGDLFRSESIERNGRDTGADPLVFLLGKGLGPELARSFARAGETRAECESRIAFGKDVPTVADRAALARRLAEHTRTEPMVVDPDAALRAEMTAWADEMCKATRVIVREPEIRDRLVARAQAQGTKGSRARLRGIAQQVASEFVFPCARVQGGTTFQ